MTQGDIFGIVAGLGIAACQGGSVTRRQVGQSDVGANTLPTDNQQPLVLLTTVPGEPHLLGVFMVEALLALRGIRTLPRGAQTPLKDIAEAARVHCVQVVALSFSAAYPARHLQPVLTELRQVLDSTIRLWVGGAGTSRLAKGLKGIEHVSGLSELLTNA